MRNGEPIKLGKPNGDYDESSKMYVHRCVARLDKGIPNPKVRPTLPMDWQLEFTLTIFRNPTIQEQRVKWLFDEGGIAIGLGTFRGSFGKFEVSIWE
jgi:hypothetical protein